MQIRDRIKSLRRVPASQLRPNPRNWRTHPDAQRDALRGVLAEIGIADAVLARELSDGTLELIDGHLRTETLPDQLIPVLILDLDDAEAAKLIACLDPLASMAEADQEQLGALLREIKTDSEALDAMLMKLAVDAKLEAAKQEPAAEPRDDPGPQIDRAAELQAEWKTEPGQLWLIEGQAGVHRLLCGDAGSQPDLIRLASGCLFDLLVTSPPYNIGIESMHGSGMFEGDSWTKKVRTLAYNDTKDEHEYQAEQSACLKRWYSVMKDCASVFYNHQNRSRKKNLISPLEWLPGPFNLRQEIVWKRRGGLGLNNRSFLQCDQRIYWLYKGHDFQFNDETEIKAWSTVWEMDVPPSSLHSVPFPIELPSRCIRACSGPGASVFEPYLGSGTTMVAAEQLGRVCCGMEIGPKYCAVILERMKGLGLEPRLAEGKTGDTTKPRRAKATKRGKKRTQD